MNRRKGQSILEYVIVLTAIIAAIVVAATSFIKPTIESSMGNVQRSIAASTNKLPGANGTP
jgi:uncharacterized protein (UPF0333 family)